MDKHIFSRWQVSLCALFVLADGLYLPLSGTGWLALLCAAAVSAALLFLLLRLPRTLLDAACALLAEKSIHGHSGARDLRNNLRRMVEDKLASLLVQKGEGAVSGIALSANGEELTLETL